MSIPARVQGGVQPQKEVWQRTPTNSTKDGSHKRNNQKAKISLTSATDEGNSTASLRLVIHLPIEVPMWAAEFPP